MKRRKGYVNVSVDTDVDIYINDIIDELDDELLIDEVKDRKLEKEFIVVRSTEITYNSICDFLCVNYHTPVDKLMELLKEQI